MRSLEKIAEEIKNCRECRKNKFGLPVPGEGHPNAEIMFVGEAPGLQESKVGKPFVGRAGKLLTYLLDLIGLDRKEVYITSPVKYYPGMRAPTSEEIEHGRKHLIKQIDAINPKIVVPLGNVSLRALFPKKKLSITRIHGKLIYADRTYFPTFHPAAAVRFKKYKEKLEKDFKKLKKLKAKNLVKRV